jgi:hypothetical protein
VGDQWDHVALAVESRLVVSMIPGRRTEGQTELLVQDFARRANGGQPPRLITSDEYKPYQAAVLATYGEWVVPPRTGRPGRPRKAYQVPPADLVYAIVHKTRQNGKVTEVEARLIYGTPQALLAALAASPASRAVNIAFVERVNGTDRHLNARKVRKTYRFSKSIEMHVAQSWLSVTYYNFCWDHRSLRMRRPDGSFQHRSPAVAAKLTDHIWTIHELAHYPVTRWYPIASTD